MSLAEEIRRALRRDFPHLSSRRDALAVQRAFLRGWSPPRKTGRRRSQLITAAHADWKDGLRGIALYDWHIPGFRKMGYWKKKAKITKLMDAIRKRERRRTNAQRCPRDKFPA